MTHTTPEASKVTTLDFPDAPQPVRDLSAQGVSIWLDDLSRPMVREGELQKLLDTRAVVGVTTNPSIFSKALSEAADYDEQVRELAAEGVDVDEAVYRITTTDVAEACDLLRPVYDRTGGQDGRVSIEVDPRMAADTAATVEMAERLWATIDRPNLLIKIPATVEGLPAITQVIAQGISVNVTLIFSLDRYRGVMNAYLTGLEQAREAGRDLSSIHSVASFFVSRVDAEVDKRLTELDDPRAAELKGRAALANARLAYQAYDEVFSTPRWANLSDAGANVQRPLWASTSVKDESLPDTLYVTELVAPNTVNTMPGATLEAVADHAEVTGDTVQGTYEESAEVLNALEALGIRYQEVVEVLEREGVEKFTDAWADLLESVTEQLDAATA
ncbi:transaldolase [Kytococcus sedentarius]|uniref:Transaldolase n=1 Tax=Kytococcus sedentarius (strain ATCC 14392 / DSM 20547 / JCM 11482 / CCUG 33030 / NBRC 15357 / NCTC 11040 / CCM 314 / 541) TaxID=478801 RepID=C7NHJ4_KYTSD|nr:transaldolase [Kytococcus sedentarius]ACV06351.1 transaldolase [Kytococcus sedentarius DSM 20547]QQB64677.1 transaldolase [Kytococcus sedentarius]STX12231.1 Transaldolase [Kytococcus sedentarius]